MKDLIGSDEALLEQLNKGLKLKMTLDVVSNFKKIFFEVLKNPEMTSELGPIVMCLSPAVLL